MSKLSLRKYGYKIEAPKERRLYSLYLACLDYDKKVVMERMKRLGSFHPVMMEDYEEYFDAYEAEAETGVSSDPVDSSDSVDSESQIEIEIDGVQDACKIFCDLCCVIDETKAISFVEDAVASITEHLRIEDEKWQMFKDNFHAKRDKMVSEFNDFEKCVEVLAKDWNGENWLSGFLSEEFFKVSKEKYQKTMKQMEKIELQSKKLKQRKLHELTSSKEIFEVRYLRTEMRVMCEELFKLFPVARFYNLLKHTI